MTDRKHVPIGGIIHTYQRYDPQQVPSPLQPEPDLVSTAFEHLLAYGSLRELTEEELARAVQIDPSQIAGLLPSLYSLMELLRQRKQKILQTYEVDTVQAEAARRYHQLARQLRLPPLLLKRFGRAVQEEQLYELERLWFAAGGEKSPLSAQILQLIQRLGEKYQIEELASKYTFTGRTPLSIPEALKIKEELELIDKLLRQLEEAAKTAQIAVIDLDDLAQFVEQGQIDNLRQLSEKVRHFLRHLAELQGLEKTRHGYQLTPKAYRLFQGRLLERIFSRLQTSRTGRHPIHVEGEGALEQAQTRPYEFGDSLAHMDIPGTFINALVRTGPRVPVQLHPDDILIHRTRNTPKCATCVIMDMSGSMHYRGLYVDVKRMALALEGLIRREYPGDWLQFIEMFTFAKLRHPSEIVTLLPRPVLLFDPIVRFRVDLSDPEVTELDIPPHFTNIQHALQLARQLLAGQDTPNRHILLITDGQPTAHLEGTVLYLLYPPHRKTIEATLREARLCRREGITINIFLLPRPADEPDDVRFAYRLAEAAAGRVFFTAGKDLDRYVIWDYLARRREIVG
jgi:uncharacterized protein with von Willebrand factor type A (vWA) domain